MGNIFEKYNIKVLGEKDFVPKLTLDDTPKAQPKPRTPSTLTPGTIFSEDGFIPDVLRTAGDTGLNYMNLGVAALNSMGADIDRNRIIDAITAVRGEQDKSDARTLSPMRKAQTDKIKVQMAAADGVVENIMAGGEAGLDMLLHPIENSGKIVGGILDPLNGVSFGAGGIAAKTAAKLGGNRIARTAGAATAGSVTNAPVNAIEEGTFAAARGEDWEKASQGAFGGGAVAGAIMGGVPGVVSKPHIAAIDPNAPIKEAMDEGIDFTANPREARQGTDGTYRGFNYPDDPNGGSGGVGGSGTAFDIGFKREPNMIGEKGIDYTDADSAAQAILDYTQRKEIAHQNGDIKLIEHSDTIIQGLHGWHEPLGNRIQEAIDTDTGNKIHDKINGIIDSEVVNRAADHVTQWADSREMIVRDEAVQAQAQIAQMLGNGMDRQTISNALDNLITPTREDMTVTSILNNNTPLPSKLSGLRPIMLLENSIKASIENPAIARSNKEFHEVLVAQGMDKGYANVMTNAYAAKDPQILRDHIYQTLRTNSPALVDHAAIKTQVAAKVDGMMYAKEAIEIENAAKQESNAKIDALMPQLEFHPSKEKDNSIFFNYDGHEYFVNAHGAMGKVGIGEDGRRRYFAEDFDQRIGLTYGERTKLAERVYALKGKEVDNTAIITHADRDANSQRVFVDYLTKGQSFKDENIDLPRAFQDFWKPTKPQSIDEFKKYVSKNKEKYTIQTLSKDSEKIDNDIQTVSKKKGISLETAQRRIPQIEEAIRGTQDAIDAIAKSDLPNDIKAKQIDANTLQIQTYLKTLEEAKQVLLNSGKKISKPIKSLSSQAQAIKDASEIPVGGSEDATKLAAQHGFKKQLDSEYKNMNEKTRADLEQNYANAPEDLYGKAQAATNEVHGNDVGSANMALIEARAKAMGITPDEFMQRTGLTIENKTDFDGAQYVRDMEEGDALFQKLPTDVTTPLKTINDTVILKDITTFDKALKNGTVSAKLDDTRDGWVSPGEVMDAAKAIRQATPRGDGSMRIYEYKNNAGDVLQITREGDGFAIRSNRKGGEGSVSKAYDYTPTHPDAAKLHQVAEAVNLSEPIINGMVDLGFRSTGEMRNTISLFSSADVSTLPHELMHVFERTLDQNERAALDHAFREYEAGEERSEAAARGFEAYLGEGKAPTKELQAVFEKFKTWLRDLWEMVFHTPENGFKLNDSQRAFYRAMMGDKEAVKEVFGEIDAAPIQKDMIAAKILDDMPEAATVEKGENTQGGLFGADDGIIQQPKLFSDKVEVDTLKVPDNIKATPQEYRTTIREMAKGESLTHPMVAEQIKRSKSYVEAKEEAIVRSSEQRLFQTNRDKNTNSSMKDGDDAEVYVGVDSDGDAVYRSFKDIFKELDDEAKLIKIMEDCLL